VATTGGGGAGAVRVSGAPSGGVSGAGAAADDVGSVIDFLSGAGVGRVAFLSQADGVFGLDQQIYSTPLATARAQRSRARSTAVLGRVRLGAALDARLTSLMESVRLTVKCG
jgi:hypothetical protein